MGVLRVLLVPLDSSVVCGSRFEFVLKVHVQIVDVVPGTNI